MIRVGVKYNAAHQMLLKKTKSTSFHSWLNSWLHSLSPPDYEQEPQLN